YSCYILAVHRDLNAIGPSRNSQVKDKIRELRRSYRDLHLAIPRIIRLLGNLQAYATFQVPIQFRVVIEVHIDSVAAGAVEISRQRTEGALQIRRTTSRVVPRVADLISGRGIESQRVAIAVHRSIQRHSGIYPVIECTLNHI